MTTRDYAIALVQGVILAVAIFALLVASSVTLA